MDIFSTHNTTMYTPNWDSQDRICSAFVLPANTKQSTHETTQRMCQVDIGPNLSGSFEYAQGQFLRLSSTLQYHQTGSSQVDAISKAQKYSRNNYWKHLQKKYFFSKKLFLKFFFEPSIFLSRTMPKNSKRGHSGSLNVFTNRKLQKMQGGTL